MKQLQIPQVILDKIQEDRTSPLVKQLADILKAVMLNKLTVSEALEELDLLARECSK